MTSSKADASKPSPRSSVSSNSEGDQSLLDDDNNDDKGKEA